MSKEVAFDLQSCIRECRNGSHDAYHQLYMKLSDELFSFISSRTNSRDDAKDILQESLLDLWRAFGSFSYKSEKQFYSFVYTIIRRKLAKYYDQYPEKHQIPLEEIAEQGIHSSVTDSMFLKKILQKLPEKTRCVIEMRYFADLTFGDIAKRLGEKETTVKVRHHRGLQKMFKYIQSYEIKA